MAEPASAPEEVSMASPTIHSISALPGATVMRMVARLLGALAIALATGLLFVTQPVPIRADTTPLVVLDPNLQVTTVLSSGLAQPIGIVFPDPANANDFFVLERASGQVKRVINGIIQPAAVLDLAVNSNSERGL